MPVAYVLENFNIILAINLQEVVYDALNPVMQSFFGVSVTPGFITGLIVTAFLLLFALIIRIFFIPRFKTSKVPGPLQMLLEYLVTYFNDSSVENVHRHASFVGPYVFTAASFIALTTLAELVGLRPTFSSINACLAFGLMTFFVIKFCGLREYGLKARLKRLINPINIIQDLSVPLSLSLRLFGAVTSGFIIMELLYASIVTSIVLPAAASVVTTLFHAGIQAFLFATLTNIFVSEAVELH